MEKRRDWTPFFYYFQDLRMIDARQIPVSAASTCVFFGKQMHVRCNEIAVDRAAASWINVAISMVSRHRQNDSVGISLKTAISLKTTELQGKQSPPTDQKGFISVLRHHLDGSSRPRSYTNFPSTNQPTNQPTAEGKHGFPLTFHFV